MLMRPSLLSKSKEKEPVLQLAEVEMVVVMFAEVATW
jgi:hypothetical protein